MASANTIEQCKKSVISDPSSECRTIKATISVKLKHITSLTKTTWNFQKANWNNFTKGLEAQIRILPKMNLSPCASPIVLVREKKGSSRVCINH